MHPDPKQGRTLMVSNTLQPHRNYSILENPTSDLPPEHRIDAAREMVNGFYTHPLPAYDRRDNVIHPSKYVHALKNAHVAIHFTLKHLGSNSLDTNIADIINMRVLIPPHPPSMIHPVGPLRRKFSLTDPFDPAL